MDAQSFASSHNEREKLREDIERIQQTLGDQGSDLDEEDSDADDEDHIEIDSDAGETAVSDIVTGAVGGKGFESVPTPMRWDVTRQVSHPSSSAWEDEGTTRLITMVQPASNDSLEDLQLLHSLETGTMLEDGELPVNMETCLALNRAYQEIITNNLEHIELILATNKEKQQSLQRELDEMSASKGCTSKRKQGSHYAFCSPYFRDVNGMLPPPNMDVLDRMSHCEINPALKPPKSWSKGDGDKLVKSVQADALKKKLVPLMTKKELLVEKKLAATSKEDEEEIQAKLKEMDQKIADIRGLSPSELVKDITDDEIDWMKISATDFLGTFTADQCHLAWKNAFHQDVYRGKWTNEEDEKLKRIAKEMNFRHWEKISELLGEETKKKRTAFQCLQRYQRKLNKDMLPGKWTPKEDEMLREAVTHCRSGDKIAWKEVSACMEGRSQDDCMRRWNGAVDTSKNVRGRWTEEEDRAILEAVKRFGEHWPLVTHFVPNRSAPQCRERWYNALDEGLKKGDWTYAEDRTLIMFVKENGRGNWNKLAAMLPGRTDNMVLQRYRRLMAWQERKKKWESQPREVKAFFEKPYEPQLNLKTRKRREEIERKKKMVEEAEKQLSDNVSELTSFDTLSRSNHSNESTNIAKTKKPVKLPIKEEPECMGDYEEAVQMQEDIKNGIIVPRPPKVHPHRYLMGSLQRRQEMMCVILNQVKKSMNKDPHSDPKKAEKIIDKILSGEVKLNDYKNKEVCEDLQKSIQSMRVSDMIQISREMKRLVCGQNIKRGKAAIPPEVKAKHAALDEELARLLCWRVTKRKKAGRPRKYMANEVIYDTSGKPLPRTPDPASIQPKITWLMMQALNVDLAGSRHRADEIRKQQVMNPESSTQASKPADPDTGDPYLQADIDLLYKLTTAKAAEEKRSKAQMARDVAVLSAEQTSDKSAANDQCNQHMFAYKGENVETSPATLQTAGVEKVAGTSVAGISQNTSTCTSVVDTAENIASTADVHTVQKKTCVTDESGSRFASNMKTYMSASQKTLNKHVTKEQALKSSMSLASKPKCLPASVINCIPGTQNTSQVPRETMRAAKNSQQPENSRNFVDGVKEDGRRISSTVMAEHSYNTTIPPLPPNSTTLNAFKMLLLNRKNLVKTAGPYLKIKSCLQKKQGAVHVYVVDGSTGNVQKVSHKHIEKESTTSDSNTPKEGGNQKPADTPHTITLRKEALEKIVKSAPASGLIRIRGDDESSITLNKQSLQKMLKRAEPCRKKANPKGKSTGDPLKAIRDTSDYRLLEARCKALFLWPAMLSTIAVKPPQPEAPAKGSTECRKTKKARSRYPCTGGKRFRKYTIKTKEEKQQQVTKLMKAFQARRNAEGTGDAGEQGVEVTPAEDEAQKETAQPEDTGLTSQETSSEAPPAKRRRGRPAGAKTKVYKVSESDIKRSSRLAGQEKRSMREPHGFVMPVECKKPRLMKKARGRSQGPQRRVATSTTTGAPQCLDQSEVESLTNGHVIALNTAPVVSEVDQTTDKSTVPVTLPGSPGPAPKSNLAKEVVATFLQPAGDSETVSEDASTVLPCFVNEEGIITCVQPCPVPPNLVQQDGSGEGENGACDRDALVPVVMTPHEVPSVPSPVAQNGAQT